jgi:regulator of cell morphogenesis and NO signaling
MGRPDIHSALREWLAYRPGLSRVFAKLGIDLCSDADTSLNELCRQKNLDPLMLMADLERANRATHGEVGIDWSTVPLSDLCQHEEKIYHAYYVRELPRLAELLAKVRAAYGQSHPEIRELDEAFQRFRTRLESHLERAKRELFPVVRQLEGLRPPAEPPDVAGVINSLERDHDAVDDELLHIRQLTHGFVAPPEVCQTFQSLLDGLWELEMNLHQNVYEENRFLFPRASRRQAALIAAGRRESHGE